MKIFKDRKKYLVFFKKNDMINNFPDCGWFHNLEGICYKTFKKKYENSDTYRLQYGLFTNMILVDSFDTKKEAYAFILEKTKIMFFIAGHKMIDDKVGIVGTSSVIKNFDSGDILTSVILESK